MVDDGMYMVPRQRIVVDDPIPEYDAVKDGGGEFVAKIAPVAVSIRRLYYVVAMD
jgi:hypothetical protein